MKRIIGLVAIILTILLSCSKPEINMGDPTIPGSNDIALNIPYYYFTATLDNKTTKSIGRAGLYSGINNTIIRIYPGEETMNVSIDVEPGSYSNYYTGYPDPNCVANFTLTKNGNDLTGQYQNYGTPNYIRFLGSTYSSEQESVIFNITETGTDSVFGKFVSGNFSGKAISPSQKSIPVSGDFRLIIK